MPCACASVCTSPTFGRHLRPLWARAVDHSLWCSTSRSACSGANAEIGILHMVKQRSLRHRLRRATSFATVFSARQVGRHALQPQGGESHRLTPCDKHHGKWTLPRARMGPRQSSRASVKVTANPGRVVWRFLRFPLSMWLPQRLKSFGW